MATDNKIILSNPVLDELYAIRRILMGQYKLYLDMGTRTWEVSYYERKVTSQDQAIAAYIAFNNVPIEHQELVIQPPVPNPPAKEQTPLSRPATPPIAPVRIPGNE